jgi:beta-lactamase class A
MLNEHIFQASDFRQFNGAFVINHLKTGEYASYNESTLVPAASLIKIPIMAEVLRLAKSGELSLRQRIRVTEADKVPFSILSMLETGNEYSVHDLLTLMIVQSDNTAANLLIDIAGFDKINGFIGELNLKNTTLRRKMMDVQARKAGRENETSAFDMALFMELLYRGKVIDAAASTSIVELMKKQLDHTMMRLYIPDETVIAHKTGELEGLAHEAGIVYHPTGDWIFVVLIWKAGTNMLARQAVGRIAKVVYDYFTEKEP